MNAGNAAELLAKPDIDGGLVGGASLKAEFGRLSTIINKILNKGCCNKIASALY